MYESIEQPSKYVVFTMGGEQKTALLRSLVYMGSVEPMVRQTAVNLVKSAPRDDHWERLSRLHRFVRDSVPYHREPVETFYRPSETLINGGDCDDHVVLLCSLAWALRYPFIVEALGDPDAPYHYTCRLGYPPNDEATGDSSTVWASFETTVDALPGEHVNAALRRIGG